MPFNLPNLFYVILQASFRADILPNLYQIIGYYNTSKIIYRRMSSCVHYNFDDFENGKDTSKYNLYYDYDNNHVNSFFVLMF
jgi:hypothetical protein